MTTSKNFTDTSVLYIVGTPIGNMSDMSPRAITILQNCTLILAEDTRHSIHLLKKFNINTKLKSYHQHNETKRAHELIEMLKQQTQSIALITDAGMPVISDPGYILVRLALENNIKVRVIPGPCAVTSAISISGIDCSQYSFYGFLSSKAKARYDELVKIMAEPRAGVIYEAPHRLLECLESIASIDNREISVVKEITKQYEDVYHGKVLDIIDKLSSLDSIKGEYVIVISADQQKSDTQQLDKDILQAFDLFKEEGIALKPAAKIIAKLFNQKKNYVYKLGLDS